MTWMNIIKQLKCPECGKRTFGVSKLREPGNQNRGTYAQHAKYECSNKKCKYSEII